ncbi:MAG: murein biosynthesis integral membrane protein MurJ [Alphaproteobacteria bacterium]
MVGCKLNFDDYMRLIRSVFTVGSLTFLSRIFGFIRDLLIASYLGAGPVADAFFVAFKLPNFFRRLFAEGAFNAAFVPTYSRTLSRDGKAAARDVASQVMSALVLILFILVLVFLLFMPWLMTGFAPGFVQTPVRFAMAIDFARVTFPYILFISLAALYSGVLNTHQRFATAAGAPILLNIAMIVALTFFSKSLETPGHALVWAVAIAGIGQMLFVQLDCKRSGVSIPLRSPQLTPQVRKLIKLMIPAAMAAGVIQLNMLIGIFFLSFLPYGAVSYFFFADRLHQFPIALVGVAVSTALLPTLSRKIERKEIQEAQVAQNRCLEFSFALAFPAAVALIVLSDPLVTTLFMRNAFTYSDSIETAHVLSAFALGLPGYVMVKVFSTSFFARHDTKTPLQAAAIAVVANIILNIVLFAPLKHVGIAFATGIAPWFNVAWLAYKLRSQNYFVADESLLSRTPKFVIASLVMGIFLDLIAREYTVSLHADEMTRIMSLTLLILSGAAVYASTLLLLRTYELRKLILFQR